MSAARLAEAQHEKGAEVVERFGSMVVESYGDSMAEYEALRASAGLVLRSDQGLVRMTGRDPVRMLNGLLTNQVAVGGTPGAVYGAMLTPKGRFVSDLRAVVGEGELIFAFPESAREPLTAHLKKYVPPLFAKWDIVEPSGVVGIYGPKAQEVYATLSGGTRILAEDEVEKLDIAGHPVIAVGSWDAGVDLLVPGDAGAVWDTIAAAVESTGGLPVGMAAYEIYRIESGRPRFGADITDEILPAEAYESTGLMPRAVSFTKGCYTGQEVVVRIAHRGHVNRHLRGVRLGSASPPAPGTAIQRVADGKDVGWITSSAESPSLGETIALGSVRRELAPGDPITVGGSPGEVAHLPLA